MSKTGIILDGGNHPVFQEPQDHPFVVCACPTYKRARLLQNVIACFYAQSYHPNRRLLYVLDDYGNLSGEVKDPRPTERIPTGAIPVLIDSTPIRFNSLPEKYNELIKRAVQTVKSLITYHERESDNIIVCIWEDDDIYLPWHISAHVNALACVQTAGRRGDWSKSSKVFSTYENSGDPQVEKSDGRFFASLGFWADTFEKVGKIPPTKRGDFDQQFIANLREHGGHGVDPLRETSYGLPSYCFRYGSTDAYHGQAFMNGAEDEEWYEKAKLAGDPQAVDILRPAFDDETRDVYRRFCRIPEGL